VTLYGLIYPYPISKSSIFWPLLFQWLISILLVPSLTLTFHKNTSTDDIDFGF